MTQEQCVPKGKEKRGRSRYKRRLKPLSRKLARHFGKEELIQDKASYYEIANVRLSLLNRIKIYKFEQQIITKMTMVSFVRYISALRSSA